jgi:hypothetical protein
MSISGAALEQVMRICCVGCDTAFDKYHYIDTNLRNLQLQRHIEKNVHIVKFQLNVNNRPYSSALISNLPV